MDFFDTACDFNTLQRTKALKYLCAKFGNTVINDDICQVNFNVAEDGSKFAPNVGRLFPCLSIFIGNNIESAVIGFLYHLIVVGAALTVHQQCSLTVDRIYNVVCIGAELTILENVMHSDVIIVHVSLGIEDRVTGVFKSRYIHAGILQNDKLTAAIHKGFIVKLKILCDCDRVGEYDANKSVRLNLGNVQLHRTELTMLRTCLGSGFFALGGLFLCSSSFFCNGSFFCYGGFFCSGSFFCGGSFFCSSDLFGSRGVLFGCVFFQLLLHGLQNRILTTQNQRPSVLNVAVFLTRLVDLIQTVIDRAEGNVVLVYLNGLQGGHAIECVSADSVYVLRDIQVLDRGCTLKCKVSDFGQRLGEGDGLISINTKRYKRTTVFKSVYANGAQHRSLGKRNRG